MLGPVSTRMGDRHQTAKPFWYVTNQPVKLSLAIPLLVDTMSTSKSWLGNDFTFFTLYVVTCGRTHANNVNRQIHLCGPNQTLESGVDSLANGFVIINFTV